MYLRSQILGLGKKKREKRGDETKRGEEEGEKREGNIKTVKIKYIQ